MHIIGIISCKCDFHNTASEFSNADFENSEAVFSFSSVQVKSKFVPSLLNVLLKLE